MQLSKTTKALALATMLSVTDVMRIFSDRTGQ